MIAAFYVPLTAGVPVVQIDPFEWVKAPVLLLEVLSEGEGDPYLAAELRVQLAC